MRTIRITTILGTAIVCAACQGGSVDIGEDKPAEVKTGLAAYAGTWDGYVEAYMFESGISDRIRLVMDEEGQGQLRFGDRGLIAKPTDQNVAYYPPQAEQLGLVFGSGFVFEGFNYSLQGSIVQSARIRTGVATEEIYGDYCGIQSATYLYRDSINGQSIDLPWTAGYSKTPVTFVGLAYVEAGSTAIVVFDQAPTTIEELSTIPTHSFPTADYSGDDPVTALTAFNLKHPDYPLLLPWAVPSVCARAADGTYELAIPLDQAVDVKLDGALEDQGNSIVGSLTIPADESRGILEATVRTVRLTRVP